MATLKDWVDEEIKNNTTDKTSSDEFDINKLRGWQRDQLKILKKLVDFKTVNGKAMANASGTVLGSPEFGGKITALTRADLMVKAGKESDGSHSWQLNDDKIERKKLKEFLEKLDI